MRKSKLSENQLIELVNMYESSVTKLHYQIGVIEGTIKDLKRDLKELRSAKKAAAKASAQKVESAASPQKKRGRGRPRKEAASPAKTVAMTSSPLAEEKPVRRRGRPRKDAAKLAAPVAEKKPRRRGRPRKDAAKSADLVAEKKPRRRGRPRKNPVSASSPQAKVAPKSKVSDDKRGYRLSDWDQLVLSTVEKSNRVLTRAELDQLVNKKAGSLKRGMNDSQVNAKISNVLHKLTNKKGLLKKGKNKENKSGYELV